MNNVVKPTLYLVKWRGNWADEIDFVGYSILDEFEVEEFKKVFKGNKKYITIYFGTNEESDFTCDRYFSECEFIKLPEEVVSFVSDEIYCHDPWSPKNVWTDYIELSEESKED